VSDGFNNLAKIKYETAQISTWVKNDGMKYCNQQGNTCVDHKFLILRIVHFPTSSAISKDTIQYYNGIHENGEGQNMYEKLKIYFDPQMYTLLVALFEI